MSQKWIEEVSMKWIDRQIVKKNGNATEIDKILKVFLSGSGEARGFSINSLVIN